VLAIAMDRAMAFTPWLLRSMMPPWGDVSPGMNRSTGTPSPFLGEKGRLTRLMPGEGAT